MKYGLLGDSGLAVSRFVLGTMYFGSETSEEDAFAIIDRYVEAGGNQLDTADVYVGGKAEHIVGRWFASRPADVTDHVILASKGRATAEASPGPNDQGLSRRYLSRKLNASLKNLGRDTIDLYQLHASDMHTPMEETIAFLADARSAGKINYVGLSNFTGWQLQLFVSTAKAMGGPVPISFQQQYSLMSRECEYEMAPAAIHNRLGMLPWSPLAGGFLTGKYQRGTTPAGGTRAGSDKDLYQWTSAEYAESDRNWATIEAVCAVAKEIGATPSQVALSWIADRPGVTAPIFGARNLDQLEENLGAVDLTLDADATAKLEEVSRPTPGGYPYGAFGQGQRNRDIGDGTPAPGVPVAGGSDHPLGRK